MNFDVVIPNGNEKQLISTAKNLGFDGLIALYEKPPKEINEKNFNLFKFCEQKRT